MVGDKSPKHSQPRNRLVTGHLVGDPYLIALRQSCPSERSRSRGGRCAWGGGWGCCERDEISCGSQGGPCDPSTKNDAGGAPAPICQQSRGRAVSGAGAEAGGFGRQSTPVRNQ